MPSQQAKVGILAQYGQELVNAFNESKDKPLELNFGGNLPPGIQNGVAHLRSLTISEYKTGANKGKPFFRGEGTCMEPKEHTWKDWLGKVQTTRTEGLVTSIQEPLCPTLDKTSGRKTFQEHFNWVCQHLQQLGWDPSVLGAAKTPQEVENLLHMAMEGLVMKSTNQSSPHYAPIYFRFRTWAGKPQQVAKDANGRWHLFEVNEQSEPTRPVVGRGPYLNENEARTKNPSAGSEPQAQSVWGEVIEHYHPSTAGDMDDQSRAGAMPDYNPQTPSVNGPAETIQEPFNEFASGGSGGGPNIDELVVKAEAKDAAAEDELIQLAVRAGYDEKEVTDADNWTIVADMIRTPKVAATAGAQETATAVAEEVAPVKGQPVHYYPLSSKTGKPVKTAVECEVKTVNKGEKTVTLLDLKDRKTEYKAVKWADLH